jgi:hypothetical protein
MFRPRRPLISVPAFSSPDLCTRRLPRSGRGVGVHPERLGAFSSLSSFCSGGSSDPRSSPIPDSFDATIPFGITSFADPHHLTSIESHLYKKQGRGWGIQRSHSTQPLPSFSTPSKHPTHSNARNFNPFMRLLNRSLDTRGGGCRPVPSRTFFALRAQSAFHNSFLFIHLRTLLENSRVCPALTLQTPALTPPVASCTSHQSRITSHRFHNFYPPTPKLRHNPAAQGHHLQSNSRTGRIQ